MRRGLIYLGLAAVVAIIVTVLLLKFPEDPDLQRAVTACTVAGSAGIGIVGQMLANNLRRAQVLEVLSRGRVSVTVGSKTDSYGHPPELMVHVAGVTIRCNEGAIRVEVEGRVQSSRSSRWFPCWRDVVILHTSAGIPGTGVSRDFGLLMRSDEVPPLTTGQTLRLQIRARTAGGTWRKAKPIGIQSEDIDTHAADN